MTPPRTLSTLISSALLASALASGANAQQPKAPRQVVKKLTRPTEVLDIQKLRAVQVAKSPNSIITCDALVVGGGLGGVAAAEALARQGFTVVLSEPTSMLGGQLTSQGVSCPDENSYIEKQPGCGTRTYRELRELLRARYKAMPGLKAGREANPGSGWVSRLCAEPLVWKQAIDDQLQPFRSAAGVREVLLRHQLVEVNRFPHNDRYHYADLVDLDSGRITRVAAKYLLDASETGDGLELAGAPCTVGAEARSEYNEPNAPETAKPNWVQSFTYCFAARWQPEGPHQIVEKPAEYDYFKSLGEYTLGYDYSDARGRVFYQVFGKVPGAGGPFWTYRRIAAAANFQGNPDYSQDLALINWRGNDFHEENPIGKPVAEQIRILRRAKAFAQGFLYWLQTECPRDDGGTGYPEMQLDLKAMGSEDGFALQPYVRESRRLQAEFMLTQQHLAPDPNDPAKKWGEEFPDSVGIALYAMDIHPSKGEPPFLSRALPYHIPLGSFIAKEGPANLLPAAKNFGATRIALASARMHPTEWLAGEVAGHLAAFCVRNRVDPAAVRNDPDLLAKFRQQLADAGIPLSWKEIIP